MLLLVTAATLAEPQCDINSLHTLDEASLDLAAFEAVRDDDPQRASACFADMLRRDPADAFASMWRGHMAVRLGDLVAAESAFTHAVDAVGERLWVEDDNEAFAQAAKHAQLSLSLRRVRERLAAAALLPAPDPSHPLRVVPIARVHRRDLSHARFVCGSIALDGAWITFDSFRGSPGEDVERPESCRFQVSPVSGLPPRPPCSLQV